MGLSGIVLQQTSWGDNANQHRRSTQAVTGRGMAGILWEDSMSNDWLRGINGATVGVQSCWRDGDDVEATVLLSTCEKAARYEHLKIIDGALVFDKYPSRDDLGAVGHEEFTQFMRDNSGAVKAFIEELLLSAFTKMLNELYTVGDDAGCIDAL